MLTFETIKAATLGEPIAAEEVLDYFDSYINVLCSHPFIDANERAEYGVDTQMKTQLQTKLLQAVLTFKV